MLRFFLNLVLLVAIAVLVGAQQGTLGFTFNDNVIELDIRTAIAALLMTLLLWWGFAKAWFAVKYGWGRHAEKARRLRHEKGWQFLTRSLNALAANDLRSCQRWLKKARSLLGEVPLVLWLEAELANRRGEVLVAHKVYQQLTHHEESAVLGWRGLLQQQQAVAQGTDVLRLTREALAVDAIAKQAFAYELRMAALAARDDWSEAFVTLNGAVKNRALTAARAKQLETVLLMNMGLHAADKNEALAHFKRAHRLRPDFAPASVAYAKALAAAGDVEVADKVIAAGWLVAPQPDLLEQYCAQHDYDDTITRLQGLEKFALRRKDNALSHLALGRLCFDAGIMGKARTHAETVLEKSASRGASLLLADIARAPGGAGETAALEHERTALAAAPLGAYVCEACGAAATVFSATCLSCHKLATQEWQDDASVWRQRGAVTDEPKLIG